MEISNGRLGFTQDLDNQKFLNALRQSNRGVTDFNAHLQSNFNQSLISVNDLAKGVTAFLTIDMARDFVTQMVKIRGEFEQTEIAFNTMLQSREKGNALMQEMVELAKNTPMQFSEVSKGAKQLLAYQVEAEKLTETLSMLGDISSGLAVPISRLILVYGQVRAKGRLMGDDLRQFTEAGVPMIAMIAKNMGVAQSSVADMVSEGKVGFKDVEKVLQDLTSQGGLFYNMMEEQSKTIPGQIAKLQDEIEQMFNSIGKDSQRFVSDVIGGASTIVENYEAIGSALTTLIATYGAYKAAVITVGLANTSVVDSMQKIQEFGDFETKRIAVKYDQAKAALELAEAEKTQSKQTLEGLRTIKEGTDLDKKKAFEKLNTAHAAKSAADLEVAAAQKQVSAYQGSIYVAKEKEAIKNLEIATTNRAIAIENVATASTNYNTTSEKANATSKSLNAGVTDFQSKKQAAATATKNLDTIATTRLTFSQRLNVAATELATIATNAWNASLLANPIVLVTVGVVGLVSAIYFLSENINGAKDAQDRFSESQQKNSDSLEKYTQNINSYISTIRDSNKTQSEQIQAYTELSNLRTNSFKDLSIEEIKLLSVADAQSKVNKETDLFKNNQLESTIIDLTNRINELNESLIEEKNIWESKRISDELSKTGQLLEEQLYIQKDLNHANLLASMSKQEQIVYLKELIDKYKDNVDVSNRVNDNLAQGTGYLNSADMATNLWNLSLSNIATNADYITTRLSGWQSLLGSLTKETNQALGKSLGDRNYDDWKAIQDKAVSDQKSLGSNKKGSEEWNKLQKDIDQATLALKAWDTTSKKVAKPKKLKKPKKADDPVEIFKKEIDGIEKQYERLFKIVDSNDASFATEKAILKAQLESKGASYEEYLRAQQKELIKTAKTSEVARKKLLLINDELLKLSKHSELQIFKDDFEKQLEDLDSVIEKLYEVQNLKESLRGKSDPLSVKKLEFIDEKQKELLNKTDDAAKDLIRTLTEESKPLDAINKKFDAQLFLLKKKINDANEEISKLTISAKSSPEGSNERIKIEEQILKLKKEILDTQNLIDFNESKRTVETKNVTNNVDYNKLLSEYQSYEDKIKAIDDKMKADLLTNQQYYETQKKALIEQGKLDEIKALDDIKNAKDAQIKKQATDDTSGLFKDKLMNSDEWANLFSDMDALTLQQLDNLILQIETQFNRLKGKFNPVDLNAIKKQLQQARNIVLQKNPFGELAKGVSELFKSAKSETTDNADDIRTKWNRVSRSVEGSFEFINDAIDSSSVLKDMLGQTAGKAMETANTVLGIGSSVLAVSQMTTEGIKGVERASVILAIISAVIQIATKIANLLSNLFSKDKKKQKEINKHKEAVDNLTNSYKDLEDAAKRALGSDVYSGQKQMIENLKQQQIEYQKMIELEKGKKKKDAGKIKEWEDALRDSKNTIQDILEEIAEDVVQTNAKDLATELGDALVEAFGKGEDAAKAFAEVANNVLKNAVLNQLKKQFLEKQLQGALDKLYKDMGGDDQGNFNFNGLSPEEQQEFRDKIKEISQNFTGMLDQYSDLFKDIIDPNESAMAGAIKGMSEETGNALLGQFNAIRILQKELVTINIDSNKILLNSLDRLANIDYNTRSVLPLLERLINRIDNAGRAYGF
ncbi:tape measure domain [Algoriella xinjiangensis]|uniref:tape measure protein n=1 Tax=Algoriella xinjiangensis TaxID=684065 RepID=UPI000F63C483|nr:tape measure protein [Algoriella xinjiangensis]VDH16102.1 tape measure domain [Algoriella xinjiangensis]